MAHKNFLFADTELGAESRATMFSIIETAKINQKNNFNSKTLHVLRIYVKGFSMS